MYKYIVRRLLLAILVLLLASLIIFWLMRGMPGDALTALIPVFPHYPASI